MVILLEEIFKEFRDWLVISSRLSWNSSKAHWTNAIKQFFKALGSAEGFDVIFTESSPGGSEYLLDLVWMQHSPRRYIQLGLESEMSGNLKRCIRAFCKMVDTKAYYKVGIFRCGSTVKEKWFQKFKHIVGDDMLGNSNETYLVIFLSFDYGQSRITITCYLLKYPSFSREIYDDSFRFDLKREDQT